MMRKSIVIIVTVALLGLLGVVANRDQSSKSQTKGQSSTDSSLGSVSNRSASYRDGAYTGSNAETPYGTVQIKVMISSGKISDIKYLRMPSGEDRSREITSFSEPQLKANTLSAQSANIDFVSGATSTSYGYQQSLQDALDKAASAALINIQLRSS